MTIRNLEHAFAPSRLPCSAHRCATALSAVSSSTTLSTAASRARSGRSIRNTLKWRVGAAIRSVADLPGIPDLGVIVTPLRDGSRYRARPRRKGTRAAVVITAGLTRENGLRQAMLDAAKPTLFRIIGPNTLGLMIPPVKLNAGFAHMAAGQAISRCCRNPAPSRLADRLGGGEQCRLFADRLARRYGGCRCRRLLDMLAGDAHTRAIVMYLGTVTDIGGRNIALYSITTTRGRTEVDRLPHPVVVVVDINAEKVDIALEATALANMLLTFSALTMASTSLKAAFVAEAANQACSRIAPRRVPGVPRSTGRASLPAAAWRCCIRSRSQRRTR